MATNLERAQAIANAIINGTATLAQINRLGVALANLDGRRVQYDAATTEQKAGYIVGKVRDYCVGAISSGEAQEAAQSAARSAASQVAQDFPPSQAPGVTIPLRT